MKIYLQDCKTLKFIRCDSSWSSNLAEALDFISVRRATAYGLTQLKDAFQLVQVDPDGFQFRAVSAQKLPVIKVVTVPRPARAGRKVCPARAVQERARPFHNWQWAVPIVIENKLLNHSAPV